MRARYAQEDVCTLIYVPLHGERHRAAIGLNRDEVYGRASAPPRWWPPSDETGNAEGVGFVAPVDLVAGGTWFGVNENGLFVAITNGRQSGAFRHERSRGDLVREALRRATVDEAVRELTNRDALAYAPCHLFLARRGRLAYVAPDTAGRFSVRWLDDAAHTLTNEGLDQNDTPPLLSTASLTDNPIEPLRRVLATHDGPHARCRHGEARGTVSSAVLLLGDDLSTSRLVFANGRPCVTPYAEVELPEELRTPART